MQTLIFTGNGTTHREAVKAAADKMKEQPKGKVKLNYLRRDEKGEWRASYSVAI